jgi:prefoldin subunit 5
VGSSVVLGKDFKHAKEYVQERVDEADNLITRLNKNADLFVKRMRELEPELQALTSKVRQAKTKKETPKKK